MGFMHPRRLFLLIAGFGLLSSGFVESLGASATKPNILFVLSDDHSYPYLSCYGDANVRTPAIDQMAAEGMIWKVPTGAWLIVLVVQFAPSSVERAKTMSAASPAA